MAAEIVPLKRRHLKALFEFYPSVRGAARHMLAGEGYAMVDGKRVIAAAGIVENWPGRATAWFLAGRATMREWVGITQAVRRGIENQKHRRLEVAVHVDRKRAVRWAERLGFEREALCKKYLPDGSDAYIYAITRD